MLFDNSFSAYELAIPYAKYDQKSQLLMPLGLTSSTTNVIALTEVHCKA